METETPAFTERKSSILIALTALILVAAIIFCVRSRWYVFAAIATVVLLVGPTHSPMAVTVTSRDVFVRFLFSTMRYGLHEITAVAVEGRDARTLRLDFPLESVKIEGFRREQVSNLERAIAAARELVTREA